MTNVSQSVNTALHFIRSKTLRTNERTNERTNWCAMTDCGLWTVDCGLWTVGCGLWGEGATVIERRLTDLQARKHSQKGTFTHLLALTHPLSLTHSVTQSLCGIQSVTQSLNHSVRHSVSQSVSHGGATQCHQISPCTKGCVNVQSCCVQYTVCFSMFQ